MKGPILSRWGYGLALALLVVVVVVPVLHLAVPADSWLHLSDYHVALAGKIMCYAICALAMDLIWGYAGILSLGHGLYFALGGYAMGMYLMRQIGHDGVYQSDLPDFMVFLDWKALPWAWALSGSFLGQLALAVAVPGVLAFVFGYFAFRSRIKGVYFSIITQAMTYAAMLLFFRNETGFGGNNGFTDFKRVLDLPLATPGMRAGLFALTGAVLVGFLALSRFIVGSKYGRVLQAIRDAEARVMFSGYDPIAYKLSIWTLSAMMCGVAGALYVPQVGIINPGEMSPAAGIEIAIWAAVGGRATLIGPVVGAFFVNGAKSWFTQILPEFWLYFLGALFIAVTLFMPDGIVGALRRAPSFVARFRKAEALEEGVSVDELDEPAERAIEADPNQLAAAMAMSEASRAEQSGSTGGVSGVSGVSGASGTSGTGSTGSSKTPANDLPTSEVQA